MKKVKLISDLGESETLIRLKEISDKQLSKGVFGTGDELVLESSYEDEVPTFYLNGDLIEKDRSIIPELNKLGQIQWEDADKQDAIEDQKLNPSIQLHDTKDLLFDEEYYALIKSNNKYYILHSDEYEYLKNADANGRLKGIFSTIKTMPTEQDLIQYCQENNISWEQSGLGPDSGLFDNSNLNINKEHMEVKSFDDLMFDEVQEKAAAEQLKKDAQKQDEAIRKTQPGIDAQIKNDEKKNDDALKEQHNQEEKVDGVDAKTFDDLLFDDGDLGHFDALLFDDAELGNYSALLFDDSETHEPEMSDLLFDDTDIHNDNISDLLFDDVDDNQNISSLLFDDVNTPQDNLQSLLFDDVDESTKEKDKRIDEDAAAIKKTVKVLEDKKKNDSFYTPESLAKEAGVTEKQATDAIKVFDEMQEKANADSLKTDEKLKDVVNNETAKRIQSQINAEEGKVSKVTEATVKEANAAIKKNQDAKREEAFDDLYFDTAKDHGQINKDKCPIESSKALAALKDLYAKQKAGKELTVDEKFFCDNMKKYFSDEDVDEYARSKGLAENMDDKEETRDELIKRLNKEHEEDTLLGKAKEAKDKIK